MAYQFRDPIHGMIEVNDKEEKLISHPLSKDSGTSVNLERPTWYTMVPSTLDLAIHSE